MAFTAIDNPELHFQCKIYTGTGSAITETMDNIGWIWMKRRDSGIRNNLFDNARGGHYTGSGFKPIIVSDANSASQGTDVDSAAKGITFGSTQTIIGTDAAGYSYNVSGHDMVRWMWATGTSFSNDASATSVGSVDTAGTISADAGFSIMTYTGVSGQQTIAHGLGAVPKMVMVKNLDSSENWRVYHHSIGAGSYLKLNDQATKTDDTGPFSNTTPTSTVITMGGDDGTMHGSEAHVAYIFADKQGYSKTGKWIGNGSSDGPYIYTGFRPAYLLYKNVDTADEFFIHDNKRQGYNDQNEILFASIDQQESTVDRIRFCANGFKTLDSDKGVNKDGDTYVYLAIAEAPLVNSKGVPGNAR